MTIFEEDLLLFKNNYNPMVERGVAEKIAAHFQAQPVQPDLKREDPFLRCFHQIKLLESQVRSGQKLTRQSTEGELFDKTFALRARAVAQDYFKGNLKADAFGVHALLYAYVLIEKAESDKRFFLKFGRNNGR